MKISRPIRLAALVGAVGMLGSLGAHAGAMFTDPLTALDPTHFFLASGAPDGQVVFDANGANFGTASAGDAGRNYLRTVDSDYATASFVAEISFVQRNVDQAVFFGLGAGEVALFGIPDWSTQFSSASFWPEAGNQKIVRFRTANDINQFQDTPVPGFAPGTHRLQMTFDNVTEVLSIALDLDYAGGAFSADTVASPINVSTLFAADGWPSDPSRIFFGGDDGIIFKDVSITVEPTDVPEPGTLSLLSLCVLALFRRRWCSTL